MWGQIASAAIGALGSALSNKGDGGGDGSQTNTPWAGLQPYLTDAYAQAKALYDSGGPEYYPNATYVPFSPQSQMAMQLVRIGR